MTAVLAVDLGGSKILACLMEDRRIVDERSAKTPRGAGVGAWLDEVAELAAPWQGRYRHAGVATTGLVRDGRWQSLNPATLPIPAGFPLDAELGRRLGMAVTTCNDAQAAAWGEHVAGAGQGVADMVFVTISTGIGGGVVSGGRLLQGRGGMTGSVGQLRLASGERIEDSASGTGIAASARAAGHAVDAKTVFVAADTGAAWALAILERVEGLTALLFRDLQSLYDPSRIVVGGGVGLAPGHLERIRTRLAGLPDVIRPELVAASLGAYAGIVGVADLALEEAGIVSEERLS